MGSRTRPTAVTTTDIFLRSEAVKAPTIVPVNEDATDDLTTEFDYIDEEESKFSSPRHRRRNLIVGGTTADPGAYPYFVEVGDYCGGSLIAPDIVLTAGHCKPKGRLSEVLVRVGAYQRTQSRHKGGDIKSTESAETFEVTKAIRYEKYHRLGGDEFRYDFCLLQLKGTSSHPFISINRNGTLPMTNTPVIAMGMGNTDKRHPSRPELLRQVQLNVISNTDCEAAKGRGISYHGRIDPVSHLCTFGRGKDSCSYDSGGPIISRLDKNKDVLVGMVSWGEECADDIFAGVNARVSGVSEWIDQTVCEWSVAPPESFRCQEEGKHIASGVVVHNERMAIYGAAGDGTQGLFLSWIVLVSSFLSVWAVITVRSRRLGSSSSPSSCMSDLCLRSSSRGGNYPYEQIE